MAPTHTKVVLALNRKSVDIIEFSKGLFNKESPVLMPGKLGSEDGSTNMIDDGLALFKKEGIIALAAAYKQFEFDSRKRMIIAAHTNDDGGNTKKHFELSELRARNVLYLLTGQKLAWAKMCAENHKIEDFQRITWYFWFARGDDWDYNLGNIDNKWDDDNSLEIIKGFLGKYDEDHKSITSDALLERIKDEKKWPQKVWEAVFDLYREEICTALGIKPKTGKKIPDVKKIPTKSLRFVNSKKKFVACGESFPFDELSGGDKNKESNKNPYHYDKYRRVEILFFYVDEAPGYMKNYKFPRRRFICPAGENDKPKSNICPIWYKNHITANYIDPAKDLKRIAYHLKFTYYDRTKTRKGAPTVRDVPERLDVEAYHYETPGTLASKKQIKTITKYHNGVYTVKLDDDPARKTIHFEFNTKVAGATPKSKWIYTKDRNSTPEMVEKTDSDMKDIYTIPTSFEEWLKYYDLPKEWSSENYWTVCKVGKKKHEGRFEDVIKKKLKIKPYPPKEKTTKASQPLVFSLDDIVLVKANGKQDIKDKDDADGSEDLSDKSRISLLHVVGRNLELYKPRDKEAPYFSKIAFKDNKENLITDVPPNTRLIIFANDFYSVYNKRAGQTAGTFDPTKATKEIKGCRAAMIGDADSHATLIVPDPGPPAVDSWNAPHYRYFARGTGNFELHYIHNGCKIAESGRMKVKVRSFLLVYWNGRFKHHRYAPVAGNKNIKNVSVNFLKGRVKKFEKQGMTNAKNRWDSKGYVFEPKSYHAQNKGKLQIKPVFFFEAKEKDRGGKHKCEVEIHNDFGKNEMGINGCWMSYKSYAVYDYLKVGKYKDIDGKTYKTLTMAHELSHGLGKDDEYSYEYWRNVAAGSRFYIADDGGYSQYYLGMPYQIDKGSMMVTNRAPRMKQLWYFVNMVNDAAEAGGKLNGLLDRAVYEMAHHFNRKPRHLYYFLTKAPNDYRDFCKPHKTGRGENTGVGKLDFALYMLGDDEMARMLKIGGKRKNFPFDGIVSVFVKVSLEFQDGTAGSWWAGGKAKKILSNWTKALKNELNQTGRFYLERTPAAGVFKRIYVHFFPCIGYWSGDAVEKAHYKIAIKLDGNNNVTARTAEVAANPGAGTPRTPPTLEVNNLASRRWVAKYILIADPTGANAGNVAKITANDLLFIRNWVASELGVANNTYRIKTS
jgi:hypothetical protein